MGILAILGEMKIKAKVLLQLEGGEPVEVGEIEIPVNVTAGPRPPVTRGGSSLDVQKG
ncbi:hypothetical protein SEA_RENNA12_1 [Arthrobacter phage Renna12]|nr:hypothetical protein SEA_RENNA12_1 [Arthrobacter phage Renna12]